MKKYRYIWIPVALLLWLAIIAWFSYPERNPSIGYTQYYISLAITLIIIGGVSYFIKKRDDNERERKNKNK